MRGNRASDPLIPYLHVIGRRLRVRDGVWWLARSAWVPLAYAAAVLLLSRVIPWPRYRLWAWLPVALWPILVSLYAALRPQRPIDVARRADAILGLKDRLSTALELSGDGAGFDPDLVARQRSDALAAARAIRPGRDLPLRWPSRWLAGAATLLAGVLVLTFVPNPMDAVLEERARVAQAAAQEADRLERLAEDVEAAEALDEAEKEALLERLRELAAELRDNRGDMEEALADLAEFRAQLRERIDPQFAARRAALEGLSAQIARLAGAEDRNPSLDEAARLLDRMLQDVDQVAPDEREALASALEEAAARLSDADAALARALRDAAAATRRGDGKAARAAAARAAGEMADARRDLALQEALARALAQADESRRRIAQAGRPGRGSGQGMAASPAGGASGRGRGGLPGGGGGTTADRLPPATRSGRAGAPTEPNRPYSVDEVVYAAPGGEPGGAGAEGRPEFIPGQEGEAGEAQVRQGASAQPGLANPSLVPYQEVYREYASEAARAMEREYIPVNLRDYVREYFTALEP